MFSFILLLDYFSNLKFKITVNFVVFTINVIFKRYLENIIFGR